MNTRMTTSRSSLLPNHRQERFPEIAGAARFLGWLRLFELELRRGTGAIGALGVALTTLWIMWQELPNGVVYWDSMNWSAGAAMAPVAAIAGGIAVWAASRDHRRHTSELVGITSFPAGVHTATAVLAVTIWSVTGYLLVAMSFYGYASARATSGGPVWDHLLLVVGAIICGVGFGWLIGTVWPRTLAPVMVMAVIWGGDILWDITHGLRDIIGRSQPRDAEMGPEGGYLAPPSGLETFFHKDGAWRFLIPAEYQSMQVSAENVTVWAVLWMVGLGVVFFLVSGWWQRRTMVPLMCALVALFIASAGGVGAAARYDTNWGIRAEDPPHTCTTRLDGALTVCLPERQEALLPETADIVAELLSPIAGRSWVPMRWESGSTETGKDLSSGMALINFYDRDEIESMELHQRILRNLLAYPGGSDRGITGGDYVVMTWLLEEAGISREEAVARGIVPEVPVLEIRPMASRTEVIPDPVPLDPVKVDAAIDRFLALPDAEREAWLDANWTEVFTGTLTLDDLP